MHLDKIQDKIIQEFDALVNGLKGKFRYFRHFATLGTLLPAINRTPAKLIRAVRSKIWLEAEYRDGKVYYSGDSDSKVIKGVLLMFIRVFSGRTPKEIMNTDVYFTYEISLYDYLPEDRRSEIASILLRMRALAARLKFKSLDADNPDALSV